MARINWEERYNTAKKEYTKERANARKRASRRRKAGIETQELPKSPLTGKKPTNYKEATKALEKETKKLPQYGREELPKKPFYKSDEHNTAWMNIYKLLSYVEYAPDNPEFTSSPPRSRKASTKELAITASKRARDIIMIELQNLIINIGAKAAYKQVIKMRSFDELMELASKAMYGYNEDEVKQGSVPLIAILRDLGMDAETSANIANELIDEE